MLRELAEAQGTRARTQRRREVRLLVAGAPLRPEVLLPSALLLPLLFLLLLPFPRCHKHSLQHSLLPDGPRGIGGASLRGATLLGRGGREGSERLTERAGRPLQ
eukprot:768707-Hanusia_phi.AAC.10